MAWLMVHRMMGCSGQRPNYWDPKFIFDEFPKIEIISNDNQPAPTAVANPSIFCHGTWQFDGINGPKAAPPKKLQLQLKKWTDNAAKQAVPLDSVVQSEPATQKRLVNHDTKTCLICAMTFKDSDELLSHVRQSETHSILVDEYIKAELHTEGEISADTGYRDRAAERREVFGLTEEEVKKQIYSEEKAKSGREGDRGSITPREPDYSVGAKLLAKMGWQEGEGLGRGGAGVTEPIKAVTLEQSRAGIGSAELIYVDESITSLNYSQQAQVSARRRFGELKDGGRPGPKSSACLSKRRRSR